VDTRDIEDLVYNVLYGAFSQNASTQDFVLRQQGSEIILSDGNGPEWTITVKRTKA
jgi:hypothetical protein